MTETTPSPLNNVITIDNERIKNHLDVSGRRVGTPGRGHDLRNDRSLAQSADRRRAYVYLDGIGLKRSWAGEVDAQEQAARVNEGAILRASDIRPAKFETLNATNPSSDHGRARKHSAPGAGRFPWRRAAALVAFCICTATPKREERLWRG
jgi:hypothetical protein